MTIISYIRLYNVKLSSISKKAFLIRVLDCPVQDHWHLSILPFCNQTLCPEVTSFWTRPCELKQTSWQKATCLRTKTRVTVGSKGFVQSQLHVKQHESTQGLLILLIKQLYIISSLHGVIFQLSTDV